MSDDEIQNNPLPDTFTEVDDQEENFDPMQYIIGLVNVCKYTFKLSEKENAKIRKSRQNMILTLLLNFEKGLKDTTFVDYEKGILKIFLKYRKEILADDENWLLDNDVKLELPGSGNVKSKKDQKVIYLSIIYRKAVELFDRHKADPITSDGKHSEFVLLPNRIFRYLYLLFLEIAEGGDENYILSEHLDNIESQLNITDRKYMEDFSLGNIFGGGNMQEGLRKIFNIVLSTATKSGIMSGEATQGFDIDKIIDTMSKLFADKDKMGDITKRISECSGDRKQAMKILMEQIDTPEMLDIIRSTTGMDMDSEKLHNLVDNSDVGNHIDDILEKIIPKLSKV